MHAAIFVVYLADKTEAEIKTIVDRIRVKYEGESSGIERRYILVTEDDIPYGIDLVKQAYEFVNKQN